MKFSVKTGPNYDDLKSAIEKISQTGKRWRYLHQTDFASRIPGSHKNTQFGGVLWGQFASANVRTEQPGRGKTDHAYNSDTHQPRAGRQFLLAYQNQWWSLFQHTPRQSQNQTHNSSKKRMLPRKAASSYQLFGSVLIHLQQDLEQLFEQLGGQNDGSRNIPLECYEFLSAKTPDEQEQLFKILLEMDKYRSK